MRIQIFMDVWQPLVNGVVRTMGSVKAELERQGHAVEVVHPGRPEFLTVPLPTYHEIRLVVNGCRAGAIIDRFRPDAVHIANEGPLGLAARLACRRRKIPYTTAYHTRLPEYARQRFPLPLFVSYPIMRWMHSQSSRVMVTTDSLKAELEARGFSRLVVTRRGVDHELFHPSRRTDLGLPRPISLCVARVAVEKNLPAFFELDIPGTKVMVGDGPDRDRLQRKYPGVVFAGLKEGATLAAFFASADVFVFPSLTDTFGLVLLEAISSGTPVAAFDVTGPRDVIEHGVNGLLGPDLRQSFFACLNLDRETVQRSSLKWSWPQCARVYLDNFHWLNGPPAPWPETGGPEPDDRLNPSS